MSAEDESTMLYSSFSSPLIHMNIRRLWPDEPGYNGTVGLMREDKKEEKGPDRRDKDWQ